LEAVGRPSAHQPGGLSPHPAYGPVAADLDHFGDPDEMVLHWLAAVKQAVRADSMTAWKFR
jgi:hypothetical protein